MSIELLIRTNPANRRLYRVFLGETLIGTTRLPFYDGARMLLKLGYDPNLLITMRHEGSAHPSFVPVPIGQAARLTVRENDEDGLRVRLYEPYPPEQPNRVQPTAHQFGFKPAGSVTHGNEVVLGA